MSSMIDLVKAVSKLGVNEELHCTLNEYNELMTELYEIDEFLQKKYPHVSCVPRIYSLYGVKITISKSN